MVRGALIVKNRHLHNIFTIILLLICLIIGLSYIKDRIKNNSYSETDSNSYDSLQPDSYDEDNYEIYYDLSFMSEETRELYNRYASLYHNSITSPLNLFYEDILAFKRDSNNALIVNYIENKTYYLSNTPYKQFIDYLSESMTEKMINSLTAETFVDTDGYVSVLEFDGPFYSNISSPYYLVFRVISSLFLTVASTASWTMEAKPPSVRALMPSMVVPRGEHTIVSNSIAPLPVAF